MQYKTNKQTNKQTNQINLSIKSNQYCEAPVFDNSRHAGIDLAIEARIVPFPDWTVRTKDGVR
jgi:hypothetical protein